ncbi:MAG TPA: DUF885 domain-containing protein [Porticoccaceae bacterium]|jgi:uncharacterized protein (DUF885 family)|nr:DUF885 domain-containing protein [Porticoccaceae bacterium]
MKYGVTLIFLASLAGYFWFWAAPVGINNYVNKVSIQLLMRSPELLTSLGLVDNTPLDFHSGKLDRYDKVSTRNALNFLRQSRDGLNDYGPKGLEGQELLSWKIVAWFFDDLIRQGEFEHGGYLVNQISGPMVNLPQFLTDRHSIKDEKSFERYLGRLKEFSRVISEVKVRVMDDRDNGVMPPDFIIEKALLGMRKFYEGGAIANPLITTLSSKLETIDEMSDQRKAELTQQAVTLVDQSVLPKYQEMIALFEEMLTLTDHDAGIWRIPQGEKIYQVALRSNNSTTLSAEKIHQIGLDEVARIEIDMQTILVNEGMSEGSIVSRVRQLMDMPEHNFPNTEEGRRQQIAYLNEVNTQVMANIEDYFITIPPQPLEIVRVPEYSQDSAPGGYYQPPALDGSSAGRFYINQKNTYDNPRWTLPTLMIHEGSPGHHFQLSASQLITGVPFLRKVSPFSAFAEGWALYSEKIAAEDMGIYLQDPLGDLGRIQAEMFRAVRLVVDTGMHAKGWSREKAIDYMLSKTGMTEAEVVREIERYVVWPGQATAYKIGQLSIVRLRSLAEERLADDFDIREFHEMILLNGAMPLEILEESVESWIDDQKTLM